MTGSLPIGIDHQKILEKLSLPGQEYLKHVREYLGDKPQEHLSASTSLKIAIIGGGICGLSSAIALGQTGHTVTVFEASEQIGAIGAGIQLAPNATRQLQRWGLGKYLQKVCVHPKYFMTRRWTDGKPLSLFRTANLLERFGSPFIQVHRGDLHQGLYDLAVSAGVSVRPGCRVTTLGHQQGSFNLESGECIEADLIIAADGIRSLARHEIDGLDLQGSARWVAYRCNLPTATVRADRELSWMVEDPHQNCWAGPDHHCQVYSMRANDLLNMVFIAPMNNTRAPSRYKDEIMEHFGHWDPKLRRLLSLIDPASVAKWPVWTASHPIQWTKQGGGKITLLGDAAHDVTPFLGQGAAMAIEDAACVEQLLLAVRSQQGRKGSDVEAALEILEALRGARARKIRQQAEANVDIWHLPDGTEQSGRDAASGLDLENPDVASSPYIFVDPEGQQWLYGYDIVEAVRGTV